MSSAVKGQTVFVKGMCFLVCFFFPLTLAARPPLSVTMDTLDRSKFRGERGLIWDITVVREISI